MTAVQIAIGHFVRMEVDLGEALGDEVEEFGFGEAVDLGGEFEVFEDVADGGGEGLDVGEEVGTDFCPGRP